VTSNYYMADIEFVILLCYLYIKHCSRVPSLTSCVVSRDVKVMCTLSTLNYNTVQTLQEVLTVATETQISVLDPSVEPS
jgi:hypothetical protein